MADTQLSILKVLRPYARFERDYDTRSGLIPVSFSDSINPGDPGATADPYAFDNKGQVVPGISPRLISMTSVPMGSTILAFLPVMPNSLLFGPGFPTIAAPCLYAWRFVFRIRNMADYNRDRRPYHVGKAAFGAPDNTGYNAPYSNATTDRVIIPGVCDTVVYTRPETPMDITNAISVNTAMVEPQQIRPEFYCLPNNARTPDAPSDVTAGLNQGIMPIGPIVPDRFTPVIPSDVFGDVQQGVFDPNFGAGNFATPVVRQPQFYPVHVKCLGDEMAVWCYKLEPNKSGDGYIVGRDWDFHVGGDGVHMSTNAEEFWFSAMFGIGATYNPAPTLYAPVRDCGVYISFGKEGI